MMVRDSATLQDVDVAQGRLDEAATIVLWEPEPPGVGLIVTYELIRRHTARVTLVGEFDYFAVDQTRDALLSALTWAVNWIEVDAESLRFCDVAGLELLLDFDRRCAQQAGGLRIANAQRQLTRLLELNEQTSLVTRLGSVIGHVRQDFKEQLDRALNSRVVIEQAAGMVAQREGTDIEHALTRLRRHARNHNQRLAELAERLVRGDIDYSTLQ